MIARHLALLFVLACVWAVLERPAPSHAEGGIPRLTVGEPVPPPEWALLQRELLRANAVACREFFDRYFDERGFLLCVERWGGDDGPDDAIENVNDWPHLYALGAPEDILRMTRKAYEGHVRQYTLAKTTHVPFAKDGMYYKEFPVTFDWLHNAEGLSVFNLLGLCDPADQALRKRIRRFAGFYMNEDPGAPNYDPKQRIIRSMFNGSRGPLMRKATALDWAGDPIEVENRFKLGHGERSYQEMLAHFEEYNDIVGDHPLNLLATTLALNAYMLEGEERYRRWLVDYVEAWRRRMEDNGGIIPSNIGLDGRIGGETGGRWWGGVYGWGFTVKVPQTGEPAHRNIVAMSFVGFMNAYLLTGDDRFLAPWRAQQDRINAEKKVENGRVLTPRMFNDRGWYNFVAGEYRENMRELYALSQRPEDRRRAGSDGWLEYLEGANPGYAVASLRSDFERLRRRVEGMRADTTTPDTRLADDPMDYNPASVTSLIELAEGGPHITRRAAPLFCRLRYFDAGRRRPGLPEDVGALIERMSGDRVTVLLANVSQSASRSVILQGGAYAEHEFQAVDAGKGERPVDGPRLRVDLAPGAQARLMIRMKRFANRPTLATPWSD